MSFSGLVLTRNGRKEMMKAVDGESLSFTHIIFGDGSTTELYNLKENVSNEICRLPITEVERQENKIILSLDYTNKSFPKGFYFRELGVLGNGKLCYYDNSGADAEYIDPDAESVSKEKRLRIEIIVSDEAKIETTAVGGLYVLENPSYEMAEELVELTSGEKMKTSLGKIAKAISSLITHLADKVSHITATERTAWNSKAEGNHTHNYAGSSSAGGSATSAVKLQNARTIRTNLQSTSTASFDGTANVTPGVTGVLPVANGGTGKDTLSDSYNALIRSKTYDGNQTIYDEDRLTIEHEEIEGEFNILRTSFACVWKYIQNKISSVLGLSTSGYTGNSASASKLNLPNTTYGSQTQPVYFTNGKPATCSYMLNKSVPSDAKFTDTTYSNATTSTAGLMSASDKSKLNNLTIASISMETLGLKGKTSSVADFFSALTTKGYSTCGVLYFDYNNAASGSITGSNITISINGCQCIITNYTGNAWVRKNAIISLPGKTYNVWARYEGSTSIADSGIVDLSANTWRPVQNNLTSTSTSDCLSAYQGKLLKERVQLLENADTFKLTNNSYIKIKGNVVTLYSYGGASTTSALNSIKLQSKYRPLYPIHIAGYICRVGYTSRYPAYLSIGSDGVMGVYFMQQIGGDAIYHNGTDYWFDGCGTWLNQTS